MPNAFNQRRLGARRAQSKAPLLRHASFLACLLLAGCATLAPQPAAFGPIGDTFYLSGRVSVKYDSAAASGRISWEHEPGSDDLLLSSPLGQGIAHIVRSDARYTLSTSDRKVYRANDAESLTEQALGWRLPLAGLPDWVRGRPSPGTPAQTRLDGARRIAELRQSGWLVEFLEYDGALPARLRLTRKDVEIRLAIDAWRSAP